MVQRLDRYAQGNSKALAVVRVPTEKEEQERAVSRHREQLQKDRQRHEAQGRSLLLSQGRRISGQWWKDRAWKKLIAGLEAWQVEILENLRHQILTTEGMLQKLSTTIESQAKAQPKGFGLLTASVCPIARCKCSAIKKR